MATLHPRMFIAQPTLEAWVEAGLARLEEDVVHLERPGRAYRLEPAVRFVRAVEPDAGEGVERLIGKVLTEARLKTLQGEQLEGSVLLGDWAFEVDAGYVGILLDGNSREEV